MIKLIGIQTCQGTNKKGEAYSGYKLYLTDDAYSKRVQGEYCFSEYVPRTENFETFCSSPLLGEAVNLEYNRWGHLQSIRYAEG